MDSIEPGDYVDIDEYYTELIDQGHDVVIENITESTNGFLAVIKVNGIEHAEFDALHGSCMVSKVSTPLSDIIE